MRTAKDQISLRNRVVWLGPSQFANRITGNSEMCQWRVNARMRLCLLHMWICAFCACSKIPFCLERPIYRHLITKDLQWAQITCTVYIIRLGIGRPKHSESTSNPYLQTVFASYPAVFTHYRVVKSTCLKFRTSMVRGYGTPIFRVNTVPPDIENDTYIQKQKRIKGFSRRGLT